MSVCGSTPAASACSAWARPISPPSIVTAALFDMFCGLNGRTRWPRRVASAREPRDDERLADVGARSLDHQCARHAIEISALELDAGLGLDAGPERVLHQRHLGDEVGSVDQLLLGIAAGQHDMRQRRF